MKLLDYAEAANMLRLSPITLRKKLMRREVPFIKMFGKKSRTFFKAEDLEALVEASRVEPKDARAAT